MNQFLLVYVVYIIFSIILDSYSIEISLLHNRRLGFIFLLISYIMTSIYFIVYTLNYIYLSLTIIVYLILIPLIFFNLNKLKLASLLLLISNEILMSILYFVILYNGNLPLVFSTLYRYSTNLQSYNVGFLELSLISILEIPNSFMFFLMVYPEIVYISIRTKNLNSLILPSLALLGPNVNSNMTHAILPIPYDPYREASIFIGIYSLLSSIYYGVRFRSNKITPIQFYTFLTLNTLLSISSYIYSLYLNKVLYGLITYITLILSLINLDYNLNKIKFIEFLLFLPQIFWSLSITLFFNIPYASLPLSFSFSIVTIIPLLLTNKIRK